MMFLSVQLQVCSFFETRKLQCVCAFVDSNDLHVSAQAFADAAAQNATALQDLENRLGLTNPDERESVLQRGRQEVLYKTKERLSSHLEMLHLSIKRKRETITKDTSLLIDLDTL